MDGIVRKVQNVSKVMADEFVKHNPHATPCKMFIKNAIQFEILRLFSSVLVCFGAPSEKGLAVKKGMASRHKRALRHSSRKTVT